jgi:hypothetical protein
MSVRWNGFTLVALLATGCAAELEDPARFLDGGIISEVTCEVDVEADILAARCGGSVCHSAEEGRAAGLDLVTPGVAARVSGVASASNDCNGAMLAVPGDPATSLMYTKVSASPPCGSRMPLAQDPLSDEEIGCIATWIRGMQ